MLAAGHYFSPVMSVEEVIDGVPCHRMPHCFLICLMNGGNFYDVSIFCLLLEAAISNWPIPQPVLPARRTSCRKCLRMFRYDWSSRHLSWAWRCVLESIFFQPCAMESVQWGFDLKKWWLLFERIKKSSRHRDLLRDSKVVITILNGNKWGERADYDENQAIPYRRLRVCSSVTV